MKDNNYNLLIEIKDQKIYIDELIKKGFKDEKIVARDTRQANSFLGSIIYHQATYYEGITLEIFNNERVLIKANNLKQMEADIFNHVRDLEIKIESFGDSIWANRFEFNDENAAKELEIEREEYRDILSDLKAAKEKILQKK